MLSEKRSATTPKWRLFLSPLEKDEMVPDRPCFTSERRVS